MVVPLIAGAVAPSFRAQLSGYDLDSLDQLGDSILGITSELRIGYWNRGWARFAVENDGAQVLERWTLGASIAGVVPAQLQAAFDAALDGARPGALGPRLRYQCSSPSIERHLDMQVHRLPAGFLIVHATRREGPVPWAPSLDTVEAYRDDAGMVVQCANCRRVRRPRTASRWDWVPALVAQRVPLVSHGLCAPCIGLLYPST